MTARITLSVRRTKISSESRLYRLRSDDRIRRIRKRAEHRLSYVKPVIGCHRQHMCTHRPRVRRTPRPATPGTPRSTRSTSLRSRNGEVGSGVSPLRCVCDVSAFSSATVPPALIITIPVAAPRLNLRQDVGRSMTTWFLPRFRIRFRISIICLGSRPIVGSSRMIIFGFPTKRLR